MSVVSCRQPGLVSIFSLGAIYVPVFENLENLPFPWQILGKTALLANQPLSGRVPGVINFTPAKLPRMPRGMPNRQARRPARRTAPSISDKRQRGAACRPGNLKVFCRPPLYSTPVTVKSATFFLFVSVAAS
jgi:hypothetical protein